MISVVVGAGLIVIAAAALVARYLPIPGHLTLYLVMASPYLMVAAPVALVVLLWGHRWILATVAVCLSLALVGTQVPWFLSARASPDAIRVRVMTINMLFGRADPQSIVAVANGQADVLLVEEFTPRAAANLAAAGLEKSFPYKSLDARPGGTGVGLYSRYPITTQEKVRGFAMAMVSTRIQVAGLTRDPAVLCVHLAAPWPQAVNGWHDDLAKLRTTMADLAAKADGAAVLVGGDFNSTVDMKQYRDLLTNGYEDSTRQAGAGRKLTYPADRGFPPVIGIDHILTRNATAVSTSTVEIPGSDHRALLATVMVPKR